MRKRYIAFVFGVVAMIAFFTMDIFAPVEKQTNQNDANEPEFIVSGISAEYFNAQGQLTQQIDAESARQMKNTQHTFFQKPSMILSDGEIPEWGIQADEGILEDNKTLKLTGHVRIVPLSTVQPAYTLSTSSLTVDLQQEIAETQDLVLIEGPATELKATGMRLLLKEEKATFLSDVRGRHDPVAH